MEIKDSLIILKRLYSKYGEDLMFNKRDLRPDYSGTGKNGHAYFGIESVDRDYIYSAIGNLTAAVNDPFGVFDFDIDIFITEENLIKDVIKVRDWLHEVTFKLKEIQVKYKDKKCAHYPIDVVLSYHEEIVKHLSSLISSDEVQNFISTFEKKDEIKVDIYFEDIQNQILEQIKKAEFSIWLAVAWLTDRVLLRELYKKKNEGLDIRIVVVDDEINLKHGINYEEHFNAKLVKPIGHYENIMHNKFCVIDLKTVIHGSYNWTNKARWNKETISIDQDREIAEKFALEFKDLFK